MRPTPSQGGYVELQATRVHTFANHRSVSMVMEDGEELPMDQRRSIFGQVASHDEIKHSHEKVFTLLMELCHWHKCAFEADEWSDYEEILRDADVDLLDEQFVKDADQFDIDEAIDSVDNGSDYSTISELGYPAVIEELRKRQKNACYGIRKREKWAPRRHWHHFQALLLFWNQEKIDADFFAEAMYILGPDVIKLVDAMCLKLPNEVMQERSVQKKLKKGPVFVEVRAIDAAPIQSLAHPVVKKVHRLTLSCAELGQQPHSELEARFFNALAEIAPKESENAWHKEGKWSFFGQYAKERVELFVSSPKFFDYLGLVSENTEFLEFALVLEKAPGCFNDRIFLESPLGQAIVFQCWRLAFPQFVFQRIMDCLFQFFLAWKVAPVCHATHSDTPVWMPYWAVVVLVYFSARGFCNLVLEFISVVWLSGHPPDHNPDGEGLRPLFLAAYLNAYTFLCLFVELATFVISMFMYMDFRVAPGEESASWSHFVQGSYPHELVKEYIGNTFIYNRPMMFALMIFAKWCILMMNMMNFEQLSITCLPAWHAIKSSESAWFLIYLLLLTFGCMLAYYALPVPDVMLGSISGYVLAFTRIFRLTLMGDFDMWGLEGVDDEVQRSDNSTSQIKHGPADYQMHNALRLWVLMLALVFAVVLLNVYVGIIGREYEEAKEKGIAVAGRFRILSCFRLLLHRRFWKSVLGGWCTLDVWTKALMKGGGYYDTGSIPVGPSSSLSLGHAAFIRMSSSRHQKVIESRAGIHQRGVNFQDTLLKCFRDHIFVRSASSIEEESFTTASDAGVETIIRKAVEETKRLYGKQQ